MAITSGFFKSVNGDRKYQAQFFASYFASFIGNGVFPNPSTNLQVTAFQNLQTRVSPGKGWINGYYILNDDSITMSHAPADGVLSRIDRIVFGVNFDSRQMNIYLKQGTLSSSPVAPSLTRNATIYELGLADVAIVPGTVSISQANITDLRLNNELCGIVNGVVNQVDTTTIFNQYLQALQDFENVQEADYLQWSNARRLEFDAWYAEIQDTLDGDVAGNLSNRINSLENNTQKATLTEAQVGTNNTKLMTPLRVKDSLRASGLVGLTDIPLGTNINTLRGRNVYYGPNATLLSQFLELSGVNEFLFMHVGSDSGFNGYQVLYALTGANQQKLFIRYINSGNFSQFFQYTTSRELGNLASLTTTDKTNIVAAINEVKQQADDIKTRWASVVGAPLTSTDTQAQLESKTQTIKSKLATYNTNKGQVSSNTETLDSLVNKVNLIQTQAPTASGTVTSSPNGNFRYMDGVDTNYPVVSVSGLGFTPKQIILSAVSTNSVVDETTYSVDRNPLLGVTIAIYSQGLSVPNTVNIKSDFGSAQISNGYFSLPVFSPNIMYSWKAIG